MPRIIRIVLWPKSEWARIGAERPRAALAHMLVVSLVLRVPRSEAAQFVAIALLAALAASTLGGAGLGVLL